MDLTDRPEPTRWPKTMTAHDAAIEQRLDRAVADLARGTAEAGHTNDIGAARARNGVPST
jgi:hypothetical protein